MVAEADELQQDLPCDILAEQAAVGACLLPQGRSVTAEVLAVAAPEMYFRPAHAEIMAVVRRLHDAGEPHDAIAVHSALLAAGQAARVGGAPYLHTLTEQIASPANGPWHAEKVKATYLQRRIVAAGTRMAQIGRIGGEDLEEVVAAATDAAADIDPALLGRAPAAQTWMEGLAALTDALERGRPGHPVVPVPYRDLEDLLPGSGLQPGSLVSIGALSGHGKTISALDFTRAAAAGGKSVLFFALEMSNEQLQQRVMAAETSITGGRLEVGASPRSFTEAELERYSAYVARAADMDITVDDSTDVSLAAVQARVAAHVRAGRRPDLVVIDYLQLMATPKEDRRDLELARITRGLKLIAKEHNCAVLLLAQISKDVAARPGTEERPPRLEDFRESAAIGHDSDVAMMLVNHHKADPEGDKAGTVTLHVVKNRKGPTGEVVLGTQMHYSRFACRRGATRP